MSVAKILLVIGGGIAAYKSCELVRLIRKAGGAVTCVITEGGQQFVTPMSLAALSENKVYTSLFDLKDEVEMGHIELSREADLVVVCPATADLLAKMAAGIADDLATTLILATDKPVLVAPAMNVKMWQHAATQRNVDWLRQAGVTVIEPDEGPMACGEFGPGRLPDPEEILAAIAAVPGLDISGPARSAPRIAQSEPAEAAGHEQDEAAPKTGGGFGGLLAKIIPRSTPRRSHEEVERSYAGLPDDEPGAIAGDHDEPAFNPTAAGSLLAKKGKAASAPPMEAPMATDPLIGQPEFDEDPAHRPLYGRHVLITAGPTREPIDPVRYIANRSSGKQGFAIAAMAAAAGARVTLIAGPVHLPTPPGVDRIDIETADEMAAEVNKALPADAAFMVAAVADWKTRAVADEKIKKRGSAPPALALAENPDILATLAASDRRPALLVGFAAETEHVLENATAKRHRKGADWIIANDVAFSDGKSVMGGDLNEVHIVSAHGVESLPQMPKDKVARELVQRAARALDAMEDNGNG